jgi:hypothetical protein
MAIGAFSKKCFFDGGVAVLIFPLSRAEHRRCGREKARGLFDPTGRWGSFRALRPGKPDDAASIMLSGKAHSEARRAAIARL